MEKLSKKTKFVIIGAGSAGISTALALKENGFHNITVLEKSDYIGGKCCSFFYDKKNFDLGANLTTPRYNSVRELADKLGMTLRKPPTREIKNVGVQEYDALSDASIFKKLIIKAGALIYSMFQELSGINKQGYAGLKSGVEKPFGEWLDYHGLGRFKEMFEVLFVAYGYGHVMKLPAIYALKFFDKTHINAAVKVILGEDVATTMDFEEGYQELWNRVVDFYEIKVHCNIDVKSVLRNPQGVIVNYTSTKSILDYTFKADKIILACPLQNINFLDQSKEEKDLFSRISTYDYYVSVSKINNLPEVSTYIYPYARELTPGYPTAVYPPNGGDIFVSYSYGGDGITEAVIKDRLRETVSKIGGQVEEILYVKKWEYFPHVELKDVQHGFYDRLENLQGQFNTYYVGEILSFTLVELILDYSRNLVEKHIL